MTTYQRRHYEDVAGILKDIKQDIKELEGVVFESESLEAARQGVVRIIEEDFITLFAKDNPLFKRNRFRKAASE
tara:strand:- start:518 stop:739 length:222 start_codon:yes stop_codon:yes gene_type:complete